MIFYKGIQELINRINNFEINLKSNNTNIIITKPSSNILNGFEILVSNESDTLGNLIQDYISNNYCSDDDDSNVICIDSPHLKKNLSNNSNFGGVDVWWVECSCY